MLGRLDGKVAIVTGAARGSGALIAKRLVEDGARVVLVDILDDRGKPEAEALGAAARYQHLDITDEQQWQAAVDFTLAEFGGLTTLVNNAAVLHIAPIEHTSLEDYSRVLQVNAVGTFLGVRSVIAPMRAAGGGSIINLASISGRRPSPGTAAYAASKFAVRGLTKVAALELGRYGIRVNSVNPAMGNPEMVLESLGLTGTDLGALRGTGGRQKRGVLLGGRWRTWRTPWRSSPRMTAPFSTARTSTWTAASRLASSCPARFPARPGPNRKSRPEFRIVHTLDGVEL